MIVLQVHDKYLTVLSNHLERRFPASNILDSFQLFDCKRAKDRCLDLEYGQEELQVLDYISIINLFIKCKKRRQQKFPKNLFLLKMFYLPSHFGRPVWAGCE